MKHHFKYIVSFCAVLLVSSCGKDFLDAMAALPTPSGSVKTSDCYTALAKLGLMTAPKVRAALSVCDAASPWNTGNGISWNGVSTEWPAGLTQAEYVLPNKRLSWLKGASMPMGVCPDAGCDGSYAYLT